MIKIAGIQKLTLLDFPGHTACTVFLAGCNMRCGFCHNRELVVPEGIAKVSDSFISEEAFWNFLSERKGLIEGVCVTGGEPTLHRDLPDFLRKIKNLGFLVKLDTNGTNSKMLRALLDKGGLDYVAMDIKASKENYASLVRPVGNVEGSLNEIFKSMNMVMKSDIEYEFRTTMIREVHTDAEFRAILELVKGAKRYFLQNFTNKGDCLDSKFKKYSGFSGVQLETLKQQALEYVDYCGVRI